MGFIYRKLLYADAMNETITKLTELCEPFCDPSNDLGYCEPPCLTFCSLFCPSQVPSPTPSISSSHQHPNKALITTLLVLSIIFVLACFIAAYIKFHSRRTTTGLSRNEESHDEFLDEDQFPVLDHPIWYINTIGLQPSVISAITVCKYVKGEGLVEGTECSVCLNEFQEDETLRLLPKCGHAFHVPCIDTWLRSHTNCPMCRAPIVSTTAVTATTSSTPSAGEENTEIVAADSREQSRRELEVGHGEEEEGESSSRCEDGIQTLRRSVSLDSSSAFNISQALSNVLAVNSDKNLSDNQNGREDEINIEDVSKRIYGNQRLLRFMGSSFRRSSQMGTSGSLERSISCSGKLFMSRYSRNQNPRLPL